MTSSGYVDNHYRIDVFGKNRGMIRRVRSSLYARRRVQVFKPAIDVRRQGDRHPLAQRGCPMPPSLLNLAASCTGACEPETRDRRDRGDPVLRRRHHYRLRDAGRSRLSGRRRRTGMDFRARPFGPMPTLLSIADEVVKLHAICMVCGAEASRTQRLINGMPAPATAPTVLIGAAEQYEARCRRHQRCPPRAMSR